MSAFQTVEFVGVCVDLHLGRAVVFATCLQLRQDAVSWNCEIHISLVLGGIVAFTVPYFIRWHFYVNELESAHWFWFRRVSEDFVGLVFVNSC